MLPSCLDVLLGGTREPQEIVGTQVRLGYIVPEPKKMGHKTNTLQKMEN